MGGARGLGGVLGAREPRGEVGQGLSRGRRPAPPPHPHSSGFPLPTAHECCGVISSPTMPGVRTAITPISIRRPRPRGRACAGPFTPGPRVGLNTVGLQSATHLRLRSGGRPDEAVQKRIVARRRDLRAPPLAWVRQHRSLRPRQRKGKSGSSGPKSRSGCTALPPSYLLALNLRWGARP